MPTAFAVFPHGVIGNTTVFGTVILGSSPGGEAFRLPPFTGVFAGGRGFLLSSLSGGFRWFKAVSCRVCRGIAWPFKPPLKRRKDPHPAKGEGQTS